MTTTIRNLILIALLAAIVFVSACKRSDAPEECVDPKGTAVTPKEASKSAAAPVKMNDKDIPWCRSCVVGPAGFMSCQTVRKENTAETDAALRDRARIAACVDSGFTKDNCPASNVVSTACKGDPPPADKTAAAKAMLNALKSSGPVVVTKDGKTLPNAMYKEPAGPGEPPAEKTDAASKDEKPVSDKNKASSPPGEPPVI